MGITAKISASRAMGCWAKSFAATAAPAHATARGINRARLRLLLSRQATRLEFSGGPTTKINPHLSFYGQAGYQFAVSQTTDGVARNALTADAGLRYQW